jgi:uncharacterized protein HemX
MTGDRPAPPYRTRRNGNGVLGFVILLALLAMAAGTFLSSHQQVTEYQCGISACTVTNLPVTSTQGP